MHKLLLQCVDWHPVPIYADIHQNLLFKTLHSKLRKECLNHKTLTLTVLIVLAITLTNDTNIRKKFLRSYFNTGPVALTLRKVAGRERKNWADGRVSTVDVIKSRRVRCVRSNRPKAARRHLPTKDLFFRKSWITKGRTASSTPGTNVIKLFTSPLTPYYSKVARLSLTNILWQA